MLEGWLTHRMTDRLSPPQVNISYHSELYLDRQTKEGARILDSGLKLPSTRLRADQGISLCILSLPRTKPPHHPAKQSAETDDLHPLVRFPPLFCRTNTSESYGTQTTARTRQHPGSIHPAWKEHIPRTKHTSMIL